MIYLINISLILITLCLGFWFSPALPIPMQDLLGSKDFLAVVAIGIICFAIISTKGVLYSLRYKSLVCLMAYLAAHQFLIPRIEFPGELESILANRWGYRSLFWMFLYFWFFCLISARSYSVEEIKSVFKTMFGLAIVSVLYLFLQFAGLDEFQSLNGFQSTFFTTAKELTAFFGHPNYAGAFLACCAPFAIYTRKWWGLGLICLGVLLCQSYWAAGGLFVGLLFYTWHRGKSCHKWAFVAVLSAIAAFFAFTQPHIADNGRFFTWSQMVRDLFHSPYVPGNPSFVIFGYGVGSFSLIFRALYDTPITMVFVQAHNEFLQFFYETGAVGIGLVFWAIGDMWKRTADYLNKDEIILAIASSLIIMFTCSIGLFVWQLEPHRFITVLFLGFLFSLTKRRTLE